MRQRWVATAVQQQVQQASKWDGIAFTQRAHAAPLLLVRGSNGSMLSFLNVLAYGGMLIRLCVFQSACHKLRVVV